MGQRNILCTHSMLDLEPEQAFTHNISNDHIHSGEFVTYSNSTPPVSSDPRSSADATLQQFQQHHDGPFHGHHYDNLQHFHHIPNHDFGGAAPPNFYNPYMLPPSSNRTFHFPHPELVQSSSNRFGGINMDGHYGRDSFFMGNIRGSPKSKNAEALPVSFRMSGLENADLPSSNQFQNSGLPCWDAPPFVTPPEYQVNGSIVVEGSDRSLRCRPGLVTFQPESALASHYNHLLNGSSMRQSILPTNGAWMSQFVNEVSNPNGPNWNSVSAQGYMHGSCLNSGVAESANIRVQAYQEASSSRDSAVPMHSAPLPNYHQNLATAQNIQIHDYEHRIEIAAAYQNAFSRLRRSNISASSNHLDANPRFPVFPPGAEMIRRPHGQYPHQAQEGYSQATSEELLEIARFIRLDDLVDEHSDLRMDIEDMSYEELLALEEQIGDVSTGLAEELVLKKLKTVMYEQYATSSLQSDYSSERETCVICQVEYVENERIGALDCGHFYHTDCIKQWLLVKNSCPVCKETALATDRLG